MLRPDRRELLAASAALLAAPAAFALDAGHSRSGRLRETSGNGAVLRANEQPIRLGKSARATPAWIYGAEPFPVLRLKRGEEVSATLVNKLWQHTTIHWHGIRGPNAMDGVAYMTQEPVQPCQHFLYRFTPPDTGTYFFHPHCNTSAQLGRGLVGALIVDGDETEPFDDDVICVLKDWRLKPDGGFLPFVTPGGASRAGTFGTLRTVNASSIPRIDVPAGADIRLRLINADSTRISEIGVDGANAAVIAIDGHAVAPFALNTWRLGPAMRLDLALRTPEEGTDVRVVDYFAPEPVTLASLVPRGAARRRESFAAKPLKPAGLPEPDLARAETHQLALGATANAPNYPDPPDIVLADGTRIDVADLLCLNASTFWSIDGQSWPRQGHKYLPPPLMRFRRGQNVAIEFFNTTPHAHPMHLHWHAFKVLSADKFKRPIHWADTVLVMPDERVRIAFVADNPGNWMIHCHIIEHQDAGMMAWFRVD